MNTHLNKHEAFPVNQFVSSSMDEHKLYSSTLSSWVHAAVHWERLVNCRLPSGSCFLSSCMLGAGTDSSCLQPDTCSAVSKMSAAGEVKDVFIKSCKVLWASESENLVTNNFPSDFDELRRQMSWNERMKKSYRGSLNSFTEVDDQESHTSWLQMFLWYMNFISTA